MLTLADFMERLARGPLKNTAAVEKTNLGEIQPEYHDTIRILTNEGLREITTKKPVFTGRVRVNWMDGQSDYVLKEQNVGLYLQNFNQEEELQFTDDLFVRVNSLQIIESSNDGLVLDTEANAVKASANRILLDSTQGASTPAYNKIRFSNVFRTLYTDGVVVNYQARHPALESLSDEINLPPSLEYPLQLFVASQYILQMSGPEHSKRGDEIRAKYLQEMGEDAAQNLSTTSQIDLDMRLTERGFV